MMTRTAHSRIMNGRAIQKGEQYDRVVTSVWNFDPDTSVLTYGATVYKKDKDKKSDFWNKREHKKTAIERFEKHPIRVVIAAPENMPELSNISIDWFIAQNLIYKFGTHNKKNVDVRRIHGKVKVSDEFNKIYPGFDKFNKCWEDSMDSFYASEEFENSRCGVCVWVMSSLVMAGATAFLCLY